MQALRVSKSWRSEMGAEHTITSDEYEYLQALTRGTCNKWGVPAGRIMDLIQDVALYAVKLSKRHDDRRVPFKFRMAKLAKYWLMKSIERMNRGWLRRPVQVRYISDYEFLGSAASHSWSGFNEVDAADEVAMLSVRVKPRVMQMLFMMAGGMTTVEIGRHMGVTFQAVSEATRKAKAAMRGEALCTSTVRMR